MFPAARFGVDAVNIQANDVSQQQLGKTVLAHHGGCQPATFISHLQATVGSDHH